MKAKRQNKLPVRCLARSISCLRKAVRELREETGYKDAEILTASSEVSSRLYEVSC
jgi:hypothetical protein